MVSSHERSGSEYGFYLNIGIEPTHRMEAPIDNDSARKVFEKIYQLTLQDPFFRHGVVISRSK